MASSARLDELKKKFDENPRRYFAPLANEYRKSGDLDQAISLCRTHLPLQPGHISGHIVLAQALFEAGTLDESREIFLTALGLDPENLIALRYLGDIAKEMSDVATARSWYERVLEVDPRNDEIVQLVRDLDAPRPPAPAAEEVEQEMEETHAVSPAAAAPAPSTPPAAAPATNNDARFAPLSLDEIDIDDIATPVGGSPNEPQAPSQTGWTSSASGADASLLDDSEIDPFDIDPAASAEALYDPNAAPAHDDFFLSELSGEKSVTDQPEPVTPQGSDMWSSTSTSEPAAPVSSSEISDLDEGSFYLEPPPPEPAQASTEESTASEATQSTDAASEQVDMPGLAAFSAEYSFSDEPAESEAPTAQWAEPQPSAQPNEELASVADQRSAEWQPPTPQSSQPEQASAPDDGLGLEVMEFVPPSQTSASTSAPIMHSDVVLGNAPEMFSSEPNTTPAAFVTETMAELYLQQGFRNEALAVYRELLARNPSDANLRDRIDQIENGSIASIGLAAVSENVVESAIRRQHARPGRSVRSFFAALAGRRAPGQRRGAEPIEGAYQPPIEEASAPAAAEATYETSPASAEPESVYEAPAAPEPRVVSQPVQDGSDRITPLMSAAETLASYDPFGDTTEPTPSPEQRFESTEPTPRPAFQAPPEPLPNVEPASLAMDTAASPAPTEPPPQRTLEDLFPDTSITARTEVAAQTLATAFGRSEPQGRPTRAASNELKLDAVFRGTPEAPAADGGFSFDQFFSDSRASGGDAAATATSMPDAGRAGGPTDAHDIEQFTAWLEGLKKK